MFCRKLGILVGTRAIFCLEIGSRLWVSSQFLDGKKVGFGEKRLSLLAIKCFVALRRRWSTVGHCSNDSISIVRKRLAFDLLTFFDAHADGIGITNFLALNQELRFSAMSELERPQVM